MGLIHRSEPDPDRSTQLQGLLHLRSTPRKARVVEWGYDWRTGTGRRDYCATALLCTLLVVCAVTIGGFTNSLQLVYVEADLCESGESTLVANAALMRNITNYNAAKEAASATVNTTATAYYLANRTYNSLETRFEWPAPYELSEEERQKLETDAREGGDDCESVEDCVDGAIGWIGGIVGEDTCVGVEVPCPDIEATELLIEYEASSKSLDLFGESSNVSVSYDEALAQQALDEATDAIEVLVRRINFASSIYVLYLAFLVIVTPPFMVYGAKWKQRIVDILANVNKPLWIALIIIVWYAHEFLQSVITSSLYSIIWANFLEDPCWADPDFLVNTSVVISDTCRSITSANNLFNQASANYRYYSEVENTWWVAMGDVAPEGPFYGDADEVLLQEFPGNCSALVLLNAIQPSDGDVNWWSLFFNSGALVALLLQVVLAHWFTSWFSMLRPLTMHRGRVMIPEESQTDADLWKEVHVFARSRAVLPFCFTTILLVFLLTNLGMTSSERGMRKKVLIGALCLACLQFVIIPALIWRPRDEQIPWKVQQLVLKHAPSEDTECGDRSSSPVDGDDASGVEQYHENPMRAGRRSRLTRPASTSLDRQQIWDAEDGSSGVEASGPESSTRSERRTGSSRVDNTTARPLPEKRPSGLGAFTSWRIRGGAGADASARARNNGGSSNSTVGQRSEAQESLSNALQAAMEASRAAAAVGTRGTGDTSAPRYR